MPWAAAAATVAVGAYQADQAGNAADTAAAGEAAGRAQASSQFDITQKNQARYRNAGARGLDNYQRLLSNRDDYESQITSDIPDQFDSGSVIPDAYSQESGDYFGNIQNNVKEGFQFGREEFDQYKDPGYDFRMDEGLRALERTNARGGKRNSGYNTRSLMELGQNLGSQEFGAARGRAYQDYQSGVDREAQQYGRSAQDYGRRTSREQELYGRGRQQRVDETLRESEGYNRELGDYNRNVAREQQQYGRDIEQYNRTYVDPMSREEGLVNLGQNTSVQAGAQRSQLAQANAASSARGAQYQAAGQLGQAGAYAGALGALGSQYQQSQQSQQSQPVNYDYGGGTNYPARPPATTDVFSIGSGYGG